MECYVKVLQERKVYSSSREGGSVIKLFCPVMGEIVLTGKAAEDARKRIDEMGKVKKTMQID